MYRLVARDWPDHQLLLHQLPVTRLVSRYMCFGRVVTGSARRDTENEGFLAEDLKIYCLCHSPKEYNSV